MLARKTSLFFIAPSLLVALLPQACAKGGEIDQGSYEAVGDLGSDPVTTATADTSAGQGSTPGISTVAATASASQSTSTGATDTTGTDTTAVSTAPETGPVAAADLPAGTDTTDTTATDTTDGTASDTTGGTPVAPDVTTDDTAVDDTTAADDAVTDDSTATDDSIAIPDMGTGGMGGDVVTDDTAVAMGDAGVTDDTAEPVSDMVCEAPQALLDVTDVSIYYNANNTSPMGAISFRFSLQSENLNPEVNLGDVIVRYWYSSEGETFEYMFDSVGSLFRADDAMQTKLVTAEYGERSDGEEYVEFTFPEVGLTSARDLNSTEVQIRMQNNYYDQSNDWSFVASNMQAPNDHMTAYLRGCLIWGDEP
jgi:hypothetical protein